MVTITQNNLLNAGENLICHQVNCKGVMGSGVAKALRSAYPHIFTSYQVLCHSRGAKMLGELDLVQINNFQYVGNLFGEDTYGKTGLHTNYSALEACLRKVYNFAKQNNFTVAMPYKIGCGLGGGDWDGIVYPMLQSIFTDINLTLYKIGE